jgi:hypothetical protein
MIHSLLFAQTRDTWPNIFASLPDPTYPLALATMNRQVANDLGPVLAVGAGLFLLLAAGYGLARARDRFGTAALFAGPALLLLYTLATGFAYGWQKTVQFSGVFLPALLPVAVLAAWPGPGDPPRRRAGLIAAGTALLLLFGHATVRNHYEAFNWSGRKLVTGEWFDVRQWAAENPAAAPVLVVGPSFRFPYFHGMWAAWAHEPARVAYAAGDPQPGGYLLLAETNRVTALSGAAPGDGVPETLAARWSMDLVPHHDAELVVEIGAPAPPAFPTRWRVEHRSPDGSTPLSLDVSGPPPWRVTVPLLAGGVNRLHATADGVDPALTFPVVTLAVRSTGTPVTPR